MCQKIILSRIKERLLSPKTRIIDVFFCFISAIWSISILLRLMDQRINSPKIILASLSYLSMLLCLSMLNQLDLNLASMQKCQPLLPAKGNLKWNRKFLMKSHYRAILSSFYFTCKLPLILHTCQLYWAIDFTIWCRDYKTFFLRNSQWGKIS